MAFARLLIAFAAAQPRPVTLAQAIELAEAHGPDLVEARTAVPIARAGVEAAREWPNPTLSASVGSDDPVFYGGVDQRLPVFGQIGTAIDAAEAQVKVARAGLELRRIQLRAAVRRAYFALVAAMEERKLGEARLVRARQLVEITRRKLDLGTAAQLDLEQAQLEERRAAQGLEDRRLAVEVARVAVENVVGFWEPEGLAPSDPLLPLPAEPSLEALLPRMAAHPEVLLAERTADAARARATREGAAIRPIPDLALQAEDLYCSPGSLTPCKPAPADSSAALIASPSLGLRLTLSFDVPVLSQNRGAVHQAEREAEQADALARVALLRRRAQVRLALAELRGALRRSDFLEHTVVPQAVRVESLSGVAYQVGRAPLVVVLQAEAAVTDVQSQAVVAAEEAQAAFADVEEATGAAL